MSVQHTYDLATVAPALFAAITDAVRFDRRNVSVVDADTGARRLTVGARDLDGLAHVDRLVRQMAATARLLKQKVLYETSPPRRWSGDVDAALDASGDVSVLGDGLVALRGTVLALLEFFEREFARWARDYGAVEERYPVMVPVEVLHEVGYFGHFPQQVTFCTHLPEDLPLLEALLRDAGEAPGTLPASFHAAMTPAAHVLKPAVCLPCYRQHRGRVLAHADGFAVSMQNHVFRYEGAAFRSLARLWDFTVRDIVFFGAPERVEALRQDVMERSFAFAHRLGLHARLQLANDPFFLDESRNKAVYQRLGEVKYELALVLPANGDELAASSFNLHRDFYARRYDIRLPDGGPAHTACMGFGLERWVYAFLAQHGLDVASWPEAVRRAVGTPAAAS